MSRIQEIEARLAKATPHPWGVYYERGTWRVYSVPRGKGELRGETHIVPEYGKVAWPNEGGVEFMGCALGATPDADLIAHAPADLRYLLDRVAELASELERTRQERDNCHSHFAALQKAHRERHDELNRLRAALEQIAHGDAQTWPDCSARNVAKAALAGNGPDGAQGEER
jgi:hypothetical protein